MDKSYRILIALLLSAVSVFGQVETVTVGPTTRNILNSGVIGFADQQASFAGSLLETNVVAPSTPVSGKSWVYVDSTSKNFAVKNDAGVVNHGVQTQAVTGEYLTGIADNGSISKSVPAFITVFVKSVTNLTSGTPADIATISIPSVVTRWRVIGATAQNSGCEIITETQVGTPAAGTMAVFTAASGGGTQLLATTAPANGAGLGTAWAPSNNTLFSSTNTLTVRQMANSINSATISFYVTITPYP